MVHEGNYLVSALRKFHELCKQDRFEVYQTNCLTPIVAILLAIVNDRMRNRRGFSCSGDEHQHCAMQRSGAAVRFVPVPAYAEQADFGAVELGGRDKDDDEGDAGGG